MLEEEYRRYAEDARNQAQKALSPDDKRRWLKLAEEWLKLALAAEAQKASKNNF